MFHCVFDSLDNGGSISGISLEDVHHKHVDKFVFLSAGDSGYPFPIIGSRSDDTGHMGSVSVIIAGQLFAGTIGSILTQIF